MSSSIRSIIAYTLALLLVVSSGCQADTAATTAAAESAETTDTTATVAIADTANSKILIVGDSLSAGFGLEPDESWVALLQNRLTAEGYGHTVVNASISGDTTGGGLRRLPRALEVHRPGIVVIELGGNDGLRGTPVMVIRQNVSRMIALAQDAGARVVLAGMVMPPNYGQKYTDAFANVFTDLADDSDAALVPFFMDGVALDPTKMQPDQIHPNADGQPILLDNIWPVLRELL
jgi:acyl-CoA thioesterase-1